VITALLIVYLYAATMTAWIVYTNLRWNTDNTRVQAGALAFGALLLPWVAWIIGGLLRAVDRHQRAVATRETADVDAEYAELCAKGVSDV
jgi:ABC-type phosphate transport system permease subunit